MVCNLEHSLYNIKGAKYKLTYSFYNLHSAFCNIDISLYILHSALYNIHSALYNIHYALYNIHYALTNLLYASINMFITSINDPPALTEIKTIQINTFIMVYYFRATMNDNRLTCNDIPTVKFIKLQSTNFKGQMVYPTSTGITHTVSGINKTG